MCVCVCVCVCVQDYEAAAQHIATFTELDARLREHRASRDGAAGDFVSDLNADIGQVHMHTHTHTEIWATDASPCRLCDRT